MKGNALLRLEVMAGDNCIGRISDFVRLILKFESVPKCWSSLIMTGSEIIGSVKWDSTSSA